MTGICQDVLESAWECLGVSRSAKKCQGVLRSVKECERDFLECKGVQGSAWEYKGVQERCHLCHLSKIVPSIEIYFRLFKTFLCSVSI